MVDTTFIVHISDVKKFGILRVGVPKMSPIKILRVKQEFVRYIV